MPQEITQEYVQKVVNEILTRKNTPVDIKLPEISKDITSPLFNEGAEKFKTREAAPTNTETFFGQALEHNEIAAGGRALVNTISTPVFPDEQIPEGWNPYSEDNIADRDEKYWGYILDSKSPRELLYRREQSLAEMQKMERLSQGGFIASLAGGAVGIVSSPTTWFLPTIAVAKYAKASQHIIGGALKVTPSLAVNTFAHEAIVQSGHIQGSLEEWSLNSLRDTAFGVAFYGAGRALGVGGTSIDVWKSRKIVNSSYEGIDVLRKAGPNGELEGLVAQAREGMSVGAAEVSLAQKFLDNKAVSNGLIGGAVLKLGSAPIFGSPLLKGLTSKYATTVEFYNKLGNESVVTGSVARGLPRAQTAIEIRRQITNKARQAAFDIDVLYLQHNGIKPGVLSSTKAVIKQFKEGLSASRAQFDTDVMRTVITGEQSLSKEINEAAKIWTDISDDIYKSYLKSKGYSEEILPPRNAKGYMTQMYDLQELARDPKKFVETVTNSLERQDKEILGLLEPINVATEELRVLNERLKQPGADEKAINKQIRQTHKRLKKLNEDLIRDQRNGVIDPALLEERVLLTDAETKELETLLKPITNLKTKIKDAQDELPGLNRNEQKASRAKIQQLKEKVQELEVELNAMAKAGQISNKLYRESKGHITFLDPFEAPKFRQTYSDNFARSEAAEAYYDTILNLNADQISNQIINRLTGATDPNVTKTRTLLIPQKDLLDADLLVTDITKVLGMYSNALGKRIGLNTIFQGMNLDDGIKDLSQNLTLEYQKKVNAVTNAVERGPKRDKLLDKLAKEKDEQIALNSDAYNYYMGNLNGNKGVQRFGRAARNLSSITMLRNVPLLQAGEIGGIVLKQRLWPLISGGLLPFVQRVNGRIARERYNKNAIHASVAVEMQLNKYSNAVFEPTTSNGIPGTFIETTLEKGTKLAERVFLTNQITNELQKLSANVTQSRVMGDMFAMSKGKLSKADQQRLLMNGINPKDYAKWIKEFEANKGYQSSTGGYVSNWYEWKDLNLAAQMRRAIHNDIQGSILESGVLDKPFWTQDPIAGLPFQFFGYLYAAFNKFTVPLAQAPDASKWLGLSMMIAYGALVEPLRKWEKGEAYEVNTEKALDQWFVEGLVESGALGWPIEGIEMIDAILDIPYLDRYRLDKFKRRSFAGIVAGPFGGAMQNVFDVATMFIQGKINQKDLLKLRGISPLPIPIWADWAISRGIRSSNFPETKRDADYYSFIDRDN